MDQQGPGMFWNWRSDTSDSGAYKFQHYLVIRFVIAATVGFRQRNYKEHKEKVLKADASAGRYVAQRADGSTGVCNQ